MNKIKGMRDGTLILKVSCSQEEYGMKRNTQTFRFVETRQSLKA